MSCEWKHLLHQIFARLSEPAQTVSLCPQRCAIQPIGRLRRQRHNPVQCPPPWLSRRNKLPAQRGGPRV